MLLRKLLLGVSNMGMAWIEINMHWWVSKWRNFVWTQREQHILFDPHEKSRLTALPRSTRGRLHPTCQIRNSCEHTITIHSMGYARVSFDTGVRMEWHHIGWYVNIKAPPITEWSIVLVQLLPRIAGQSLVHYNVMIEVIRSTQILEDKKQHNKT